MRKHYVKKRSLSFFVLTFISSILFFCPPAFAQSHEEMEMLRMFYKEKELFSTSTRSLKSVSQIAENITVITSKEIEEMNAHSVAEILERVTGLFVDFQGHDFGSSSLLEVQGSEDRHVRVLLDGVTWNFLNGGNAETNSIPVRIIERIEIIKGPASSVWGSSLGGIINIITKSADNADQYSGTLSASYGEKNTQDYGAELSGNAGTVGYYLFAGRQDSDGSMGNRDFDKNSFYSKLNIPVSRDLKLGISLGYSEPDMGFGDYPSGNLTSRGISRAFFTTASLDAYLTKELTLNMSLHTFKQKFVQTNDVLGSPGELYLKLIDDEETIEGSGKLVWTSGRHKAVLGIDVGHSRVDHTLNAGTFLQSWGVPAATSSQTSVDKWAAYLNDTIVIDKFSITPGIRFDHNSITGSFTSPSLGATYRLGKNTIIRTSVTRGFTIPPLGLTSTGALFLDPNPSLEPEEVWSYQAGVESGLTNYLWLKATIFRHDLKESLERELFAGDAPAYNDLFFNTGKVRRQGVEIDATTIPFYNISLKAGFAYVHIKPSEAETTNIYKYNVSIKYDDKKSFIAQLFGTYSWWDLDASSMAKYDTPIWDFNLQKKIHFNQNMNTEIFFTAHNLFNGSHYTIGDMKNPRRWAEAGVRLKF